ncbi:MAG: LysE family transporter [Gammaproteobacteria bacterium]|nr:LysE family transporter [Gammaproteobacteria bacterium]
MEMHLWLLYLPAAIVLSLTPGPNTLLALTHGALYGHRRTLFTIAGGMSGFTILIVLTMFGIGALLKAAPDALIALKVVGGVYLIWLGIQIWRSPALHLAAEHKRPQASGFKLFRQGAFSALSNPKAILFFAAFLPQFLSGERELLPQLLVMVVTFVVIEFVVEYLLARLADRIRPWLRHYGKKFNKTCGGLFAMIGVAMPMSA